MLTFVTTARALYHHCQDTDTNCGRAAAQMVISSLVQSPAFDLTKTYFLIAGIAGVNPKVATLGSVAFAKYAVQIALEYEFDAREVCRAWSGPSCSSPAQFCQRGVDTGELQHGLRASGCDFTIRVSANV